MDEKHEIRLLFGGDFAPYGRYETLTTTRGREVFGQANQAIKAADFSIINLETPICGQLKSTEKSGPAIRASSETLNALSEAGVDAVCLANNHILDYGKQGLSETLNALQARDIRHVGAGLCRDKAEAPLRITIRGRRISILAFAEREFNLTENEQAGAAILDPIDATRVILKERSQAATTSSIQKRCKVIMNKLFLRNRTQQSLGLFLDPSAVKLALVHGRAICTQYTWEKP